MSTIRGFVRSIKVRNDGWVEAVLTQVHANDQTQTLLIQSPDADLNQAHRRLAKLSLLRDALAKTLPVEVAYEATQSQGLIVDDVVIYPTDSIAGHRGAWWKEGVIIELSVTELGPGKDTSPYEDLPDAAMVAVLLGGGGIESYRVDLQRPHAGTGHAMLAMLAEARRTRRAIRLWITAPPATERGAINAGKDAAAGHAAAGSAAAGGIIVACDWPVLPQNTLVRRVAFVERVGQRAESFDANKPSAVNHLWVKYTTAPEQNPEGDLSKNGSFSPQSGLAQVHQDSPLVALLVTALRDRLQVQLGLADDEIHEVEVISRLGSAAHPIWIDFSAQPLEAQTSPECTTGPTIQPPNADSLNQVPRSVAWRGSAFFTEGIWRFVLSSGSPAELRVDGKTPCTKMDEKAATAIAHAYLKGLHDVEIILRDRTCSTPFSANIYRIR